MNIAYSTDISDSEMLKHTEEKCLKETGVSPSYDEMKEALDLKSKSGIHRLITGLEGYRPFPIELYLYLLFIIIHVVFTLKVITKLNTKDSNILTFIPNLF